MSAREAWFDGQLDLDPDTLIFVDQTGASTKMARRIESRDDRNARPRYPAAIGHAQLQMAAVDNAASVTSLLLKAKLVSSKLGLAGSEMAQWIAHELDGYVGSVAALPSYRVIAAEPLAINPMRGEIPVQLSDDSPDVLRRALFELHFTNSISEIEALIARGNVSNLRVPLDSELQQIVNELTTHKMPLRYRFGPGQLTAVVEAVRSRTLTWALDLEAGGVVGADHQFTLNEKAAAVSITNNFSNNNIGNVGDVKHGGQVINNQTMSNTIAVDKVAACLPRAASAIDSGFAGRFAERHCCTCSHTRC